MGSEENWVFRPSCAGRPGGWRYEAPGVRILRLSVCSAVLVFDNVQLLQDPLARVFNGSSPLSFHGYGVLMGKLAQRKSSGSLIAPAASNVRPLNEGTVS